MKMDCFVVALLAMIGGGDELLRLTYSLTRNDNNARHTERM